MQVRHRIRFLTTTLLFSLATATALAESAPPPTAPRLPAATQGEHQSQTAPAAPQERLRVGLSDPDTKLVLPWFVTTLTDAVNQGKSANETGKALLDGL
ncbi:hypothetical protein ACOTDF_04980 [Achromobacter insuavis]|uniref:hypothetical protein n=1 Tax=Achromobacter insuavis TaxID=1287735 RepID=UPI003B9D7203